ncbi:hypothetical protein NP01_21210 [Salmonella enterica]|nr:hypothetical protein [Salmonella enterica subsp. enterica serovar Veneziana]EBP1818566.1 hypothetical protein [Salmonella enterica]ECD4177156.1 hypothetical protein [Salmonella enterica subsp. enterica serovar Napoli]EDW8759148.1 hypothetical protein [Salmonella enterica subsp. enterica]EEJ8617271.1 hypothetical protein [Salmonella enterica subsp. enterica serovar Veneziana]
MEADTMPVISGILRDGAGVPLTGCIIQLRAVSTSRDVLATMVACISTNTGLYHIEALPGQYDVFIRYEGGLTANRIGTIHIYDDSPDGTLNSFLNAKNTDTRPEALRQYELLSQQAAGAAATSDAQAKTATAAAKVAEQYATEVRGSAGKVADAEKRIAGYADTATQNAGAAMRAAAQADESRSGAQQALEEARQIAKTPGPSAYDVWVSQQPAGSDTSMQAWLSYQKGKDGRDGKDGVQPGDVASYLYRGRLTTEDLNGLTAEGIWEQPDYPVATTERHYPVFSSMGPPHGDAGRVRVSRINPLYIMQIYTSVTGMVATRMGNDRAAGYVWSDWKIFNQDTPTPGAVRAYILAYLNPADMTDDYRRTGRIDGGVLYSLHVSSMSTLTLRAERDRRWTGAEWVKAPWYDGIRWRGEKWTGTWQFMGDQGDSTGDFGLFMRIR